MFVLYITFVTIGSVYMTLYSLYEVIKKKEKPLLIAVPTNLFNHIT